MWNGRGAKAEGGGRVSKIWILALPGSIWKNSVPWKRECSIFGWLAEGAAVTVSHRLHSSSQAGWGHEQPPALPELPYIRLRHVPQQRATPKLLGNSTLLLMTSLSWCSFCISFSQCSLPSDFHLRDSFSAADKRALSLHFEGRALGRKHLFMVPYRGRHADHPISLCFFIPWQDYFSYY